MESKICGGVLAVLAIVAAQGAWAEALAGNAPRAPLRPLSPAYCKQSTITPDEFMRVLKVVLNHGDLTDIPFLEKTFMTKFKVSTGWKEDGTPDFQTTYYKSDSIFGGLVDLEIDVWGPRMQEKMGIASLDIQSQGSKDFFSRCLQLSQNQFSNAVGGRFFPVPDSPNPGQPLRGTQGTLTLGKNETELHVYDHYDYLSHFIDGIQIIQRP